MGKIIKNIMQPKKKINIERKTIKKIKQIKMKLLKEKTYLTY